MVSFKDSIKLNDLELAEKCAIHIASQMEKERSLKSMSLVDYNEDDTPLGMVREVVKRFRNLSSNLQKSKTANHVMELKVTDEEYLRLNNELDRLRSIIRFMEETHERQLRQRDKMDEVNMLARQTAMVAAVLNGCIIAGIDTKSSDSMELILKRGIDYAAKIEAINNNEKES